MSGSVKTTGAPVANTLIGTNGATAPLVTSGEAAFKSIITAGKWKDAKTALMIAKASPTAAIVDAAVSKAGDNPSDWKGDIKAVLTTLRDTIDETTLKPVITATSAEGVKAAIEQVAKWTGVLSMSPSTVEVSPTQSSPISVVRVPWSSLIDDAAKVDAKKVYAVSKQVFDGIPVIASAQSVLPNGKLVRLGHVVVIELLRLAVAVKDASETTPWAADAVQQLLFDPYVAGQGVVCGTVWTGTFAIKKRPTGVRITISWPPYTIVITVTW